MAIVIHNKPSPQRTWMPWRGGGGGGGGALTEPSPAVARHTQRKEMLPCYKNPLNRQLPRIAVLCERDASPLGEALERASHEWLGPWPQHCTAKCSSASTQRCLTAR